MGPRDYLIYFIAAVVLFQRVVRVGAIARAAGKDGITAVNRAHFWSHF
jgi:hypothetical protein